MQIQFICFKYVLILTNLFIVLHIMAIYAASFVSLEDALSSPNNTQVDLIAVVAHVGLWDCQTLFPNSFREVALKDNR